VTAVLLATGLVLVTTAVLAGLLLLAERYLANFGQCRIDINRGARVLEVKGGDSLLATLRGSGIYLASACGGRGTCAYCKATIHEGGGPVGPTEEPLLTPQEISASVRITCQCKVRNDLRIEIPEELLSVREFRGVVERIRDLTYDIKELRIRLIDPETIRFVSGQYVQLEAPPYAKVREPVFRAYSISSPPEDDRHIELIIRRVPAGFCTTWVFDHLRAGDAVKLTGPYGQFGLSRATGEMIWIAGGSGMAPFWSLVRHMQKRGLARPSVFFFGAVGERDLFLIDELRGLEAALPWFRFVPSLSGADTGGWSGERGRITEVVARYLASRAAGAEPTDRPGAAAGAGATEKPSASEVAGRDLEGYLCGSPGMIDAAVQVLRAHGVADERIFFDKFA